MFDKQITRFVKCWSDGEIPWWGRIMSDRMLPSFMDKPVAVQPVLLVIVPYCQPLLLQIGDNNPYVSCHGFIPLVTAREAVPGLRSWWLNSAEISDLTPWPPW